MEPVAPSVGVGGLPKKSGRFRHFRRHCHDWLLATSAHGWPRFASARSALARSFWLLVICGASAMFTFHLYTLVCRYLERPTATAMLPYHIPFVPPDIYLCSNQKVSQSQLLLRRSAERDKLFALAKRIIDFKRKYHRHRHDDNGNSTSSYNINTNIFQFLQHNIDFKQLSKVAGHKAEQLIIYSALSYTSISAERFFSDIYVNCFVFRLKPALFSGPGHYLKLKLFSDDFQTGLTYDNVSFMRSTTSGIRIIVAPKGHYPHISSSSITLSPGTSNVIYLSYTKVFTQPTGKNCAPQRKWPILNPSSLKKEFYYVSPTYCLDGAVTREILRRCGCRITTQYVPFEFAKTNSCFNISHLAAFNISHGKWISRCAAKVNRIAGQIQRTHGRRCMQFRHCTEHQYKLITALKLRFPRRRHGHIAEYISEKFRRYQSQNRTIHAWEDLDRHVNNVTQRRIIVDENVIDVLIRISESLSTDIEEQYTYPLANLFSDIGGILGLYLGISALTLMEVVELVLDVLRILIRRPAH